MLLGLGDETAGRDHRKPVAVPGEEATGHIVCVESRVLEGLGGHRRTCAATTVEDDRNFAIDLARSGRQLRELDVLALRDPSGCPLVSLANVDQLDLGAREQLGDLRGTVVRVHERSVPITCKIRPARLPAG